MLPTNGMMVLFPNEIYRTLMEAAGHGRFILQFEQSVQDLCMKQNILFYDFSDMAWLDASDAETLDGFHASEPTYGRIVLRFENDSVIAPYNHKEPLINCIFHPEHLINLFSYSALTLPNAPASIHAIG